MNLKEAERYFKRYGGHGFHMYQEEPAQYERYRALHISPSAEERWRQEMIQKYFKGFFDKPDQVWGSHCRVIEIMLESKTALEENCSQLLTLMERTGSLDIQQKTLVIETMAGRSATLEHGGCWLICTRTSLSERMNDVMSELIKGALSMPCEDAQRARLQSAIDLYRLAYSRFAGGACLSASRRI